MNVTQAMDDEKRFDDFWTKEVGLSWEKISDCENATCVIIDEIQIIYGDRAPFFWGKIKQLMSNYGRNKNLKILCLGVYDPVYSDLLTPVHVNHTLGLNHLLLEEKEFQELILKYIKLHDPLGSPRFNIPEDVRKAIYNLTGGHPGLCRFILSQLRIHYRDFTGDNITVKML